MRLALMICLAICGTEAAADASLEAQGARCLNPNVAPMLFNTDICKSFRNGVAYAQNRLLARSSSGGAW